MTSDTLWDRIKQGFMEGASAAAEKAGHLGRLSKARVEVARTRHAIHDAFAQLGGTVFEKLRNGQDAGLAEQGDVRNLVERIGTLESQLRAQEAALDAIKAGGRGPESGSGTSP